MSLKVCKDSKCVIVNWYSDFGIPINMYNSYLEDSLSYAYIILSKKEEKILLWTTSEKMCSVLSLRSHIRFKSSGPLNKI